MIIESIAFGAIPAIIAWNFWQSYQDQKWAEKTVKQLKEAKQNTPPSDLAAMIIELLKEDQGWHGDAMLAHDTGIVLQNKYSRAANCVTLKVFVKEGEQLGTEAEISANDRRLILAEIDGFKSRREAAKQRALTRTVAERIVALRNGTIRPVLGNHEDGAADDDSVGRSDSVPALYFDARTNRIVALGTRDAGKLTLDPSFIERYKLGYYDR